MGTRERLARTENRVRLVGLVAERPEVRYTQRGDMVVRLRVLTGPRASAVQDPADARPERHWVLVRGELAGRCRGFRPGDRVVVDGALRWFEAVLPGGYVATSVEVEADRVDACPVQPVLL